MKCVDDKYTVKSRYGSFSAEYGIDVEGDCSIQIRLASPCMARKLAELMQETAGEELNSSNYPEAEDLLSLGNFVEQMIDPLEEGRDPYEKLFPDEADT